MIWHHTRRRTHKRLAPKEPPEGMMWDPCPGRHGLIRIDEVQAIMRERVGYYDQLDKPDRDRVKDIGIGAFLRGH